MWSQLKICALILLSYWVGAINGYSYSNSTLHPEELFENVGIPVRIHTNFRMPSDRSLIKRHVENVLSPLMPYINANDNTAVALRRQDIETNQLIHLYEYQYPKIDAIQIGAYTFSCRQSNADLVVVNQIGQGQTQRRAVPIGFEFSLHPRPGLWWFVKCVQHETGGSSPDATGVSKPGGDQGIDPNALKSLIG